MPATGGDRIACVKALLRAVGFARVDYAQDSSPRFASSTRRKNVLTDMLPGRFADL
jgi:hypothetical protein